MKPLAIDLFSGVGGWTEGLLAEGYDVVGFDIERHVYGDARYPAQLVLHDVRTLHGSQFRDAALIVASPPCQEYSYMAMPWSRAKQIEREYLDGTRDRAKLTELFDACFRIQREASEAAGHHIPMVVENVRGAQKWVGRSRANFGSYHLWGDVPALMPMARAATKNDGGSWFNTTSGCANNPVSIPAGTKTVGHANRRDGHTHTRHLTNQRESDGLKVPGIKLSDVGFNVAAAQRYREGVKFSQSGDKPRDKMLGELGPAAYGSKSDSRKAASAMIAKIPFVLAQYIARTFKPAAMECRP